MAEPLFKGTHIYNNLKKVLCKTVDSAQCNYIADCHHPHHRVYVPSHRRRLVKAGCINASLTISLKNP